MADINIKLLLNKSVQVKTAGLDVSVTLNMAQYSVVAGENNSTIIEVNYPDNYKSGARYVDMKNAKGEGTRLLFSGIANIVSFPLPASMAWVGTTTLVFYSEVDNTKTLWVPVKIPIKATGIDNTEIALGSPDLLAQAIFDSTSAKEIAQSVRDDANLGAFNFQPNRFYETLALMNADLPNCNEFDNAIIQSPQGAESEDNAKMYECVQISGIKQWRFISDLSGCYWRDRCHGGDR